MPRYMMFDYGVWSRQTKQRHLDLRDIVVSVYCFMLYSRAIFLFPLTIDGLVIRGITMPS